MIKVLYFQYIPNLVMYRGYLIEIARLSMRFCWMAVVCELRRTDGYYAKTYYLLYSKGFSGTEMFMRW